ncbi:MAG: hypothetical protein ACXVXC_14895 [Nocardioidaceae bacterium]
MTSDQPGLALQRLLAGALATRDGVSASRARQLRWAASEMQLFAETLPPRRRPTTPRGWLSPAFTTRYLAAADAGTLRRRGGHQRPSPDATRRIRRACLRLMARAAGLPEPVADVVPVPAVRERADKHPAELALAHWAWRAAPVAARPGEVRAAAMAALTHEAGMRSGELAALVPADLDLVAGTVTYQPRPPAVVDLPPRRTVRLSPGAVGLLRHWLEVRAELTRETPRTRSLWVSLAGNHDGFGVKRPAGMPLRPTGLRRAHARAVASVNTWLAGTPGFEPLPRHHGLLRGPDPEDAGDGDADPAAD